MLSMIKIRFIPIKQLLSAITLLCVASTSSSALAAQTFGCLIEPYHVAEVGAQVVGIIESIKVERGESVKKGQVIAILKSGVERASVGAANTRAKANANVNASKANYEFDQSRLERSKYLLGKKFISQQAVDQIKTETEISHQKYMQAIEQQKHAKNELNIAAAQLSQRRIRSPFDGIVTDRYISTGERVEDKAIVRIAQINRLRVQVVIPVSYFGKIKINASVAITPEFPNAPTVSGQVSLIDKVIDAASNTFRVQLELDNADLALPAGSRCTADFGGDIETKTL
jgi:cobalt-zinc-cadmium efflux system membrane fusion protein